MASGSGLPETREVTMCLEMLSVRAFAVQKGWGVSELSGTRPTLSTQTESVCPPSPCNYSSKAAEEAGGNQET